jgi:mannan polymerase II complex ANP1 subunit
MAKRMKFSVIGLPHYTIWHLYEPSVDDLRHMEEMEVERLAREKEEQQRAEQKDNTQSKSLVDDQNVDGEEVQGSAEGPAGQPMKDAMDSTQGHLKAQAERVDEAEKAKS